MIIFGFFKDQFDPFHFEMPLSLRNPINLRTRLSVHSSKNHAFRAKLDGHV